MDVPWRFAIKLLFTRGPLQSFRLCALLFVSVLLMVQDYKQRYVGSVREVLAVAVAPIQYAIAWPVQAISSVSHDFSSNRSLLSVNANLRAEQAILKVQLQKMQLLEQENTQLRALLKSPLRSVYGQFIVAQLLEVDADELQQEWVLDKGRSEAVYVGQPVLDSGGVIGQVISVGPLNSRILLVSDVRSAVPVQNSRTGMRTIVGGTGISDKLTLLNVPVTSDVRVGDALITSGLGGRFPAGYNVGVISAVKHRAGEQFSVISVKPSANLNRSQQVLLVWPSEKSLASTVPAQHAVVPTSASSATLSAQR